MLRLTGVLQISFGYNSHVMHFCIHVYDTVCVICGFKFLHLSVILLSLSNCVLRIEQVSEGRRHRAIAIAEGDAQVFCLLEELFLEMPGCEGWDGTMHNVHHVYNVHNVHSMHNVHIVHPTLNCTCWPQHQSADPGKVLLWGQSILLVFLNGEIYFQATRLTSTAEAGAAEAKGKGILSLLISIFFAFFSSTLFHN